MTTAAQAAARDAAAIAAGVPSRALMQRAGAAAAAEITLRYPYHLESGVAVFAGPGNNGGDAWVVARALAAVGVRVRVVAEVPPATADALAERDLTDEVVGRSAPLRDPERHLPLGIAERLVVDGVLGTGASGAPRGAIAGSIDAILGLRAAGATIVSLDVPSGLDATTGRWEKSVVADLTLTFGTMKRGLLTARDRCGAIAVLDIGLTEHAQLDDGAPGLVDARWVAAVIPRFATDAHKGTRKRVAVIGGAAGMAGAAVLAARGAARSGVGMVKLVVAPASLPVVQEAEPAALAAPWPDDDDALRADVGEWADVVAIGPGLGRDPAARQLAERTLRTWRGPVVLDADGLNVFAGDAATLGELLRGRPALLTPHPAEFARLAGSDVERVLAERFDAGLALATRCHAVVLLKGVPTVVSAPDGRHLVSAAGSPALATAGSGDVLTGIAATLIAQIGDAFVAGAAAAWAHGRAAELAHGTPDAARRPARGLTLDDVLCALSGVWHLDPPPARYPVLFDLPAVAQVLDGATPVVSRG